MTLDQCEGALLGLALGDAMGAPFEGGIVERCVWRLIGKAKQGRRRWTDDTQMSLDLAESLIANGTVMQDDLAQRFAASYRWSRGYGPGAARLLKRIARGADWRDANRAIYPDGSYGNGAAMRAPIVGLFYADRAGERSQAARDSAVITHAHPLGIEGAVMIAAVTARAVRSGVPNELLATAGAVCRADVFLERLDVARRWIETEQSPSANQVARELGNGIAAAESCVTAVYVAARFMRDSFADMQSFIAACGGDVDTIGAMAGAIWGAANGAESLPPDQLHMLEQCERIRKVAGDLFATKPVDGL